MRYLILALTVLTLVTSTPALAVQPEVMDITETLDRVQVAYWRLHGEILHDRHFGEHGPTHVLLLQRAAQRLMVRDDISGELRHRAASLAGSTFNLTGATDLESAEYHFPPVREAFRELVAIAATVP